MKMLDAQVKSAMMFRLLFGTQDDRYEPESAGALLRAVYKLSDESAAVNVKLWVMDAEREWIKHQN